jgi:hypothetical protein
MNGSTTNHHVDLLWSVDPVDDDSWMLEVSFGDIRIQRVLPSPPSPLEAQAEADYVAPLLFRLAEVWLE